MTCVVLTKNPYGGGVLAITAGDDGSIASWPNEEEAIAVAVNHPLIEAWGGWVVDLDNLEVTEV